MSARYVIVDRFTFSYTEPRYGVLRICKSTGGGLAPVAEAHRWFWTIDSAQAEIRRLRHIDRQRAAIGSEER